MFTMQNTAIHEDFTQAQIDDMNAQLLEMYPEADSDEADEQMVKHYSDQVMENGPRC